MRDVHPAAAAGFANGAAPYERGRPDYPPALHAWLTTTLGLGPGRVAVDLGAGTGKFTRLLGATGAAVIAVEPVAAMRARLARDLPLVTVHDGTASALPLADGSIDALVCAQAFHWFDTAEALAEIRRVLRPGGMLGLVWNVRDESVAWVRRLTALFAAYEGEAPRFHTGRWRRLFPADGFGPLAALDVPWVHRGPAADVVLARVLSVSFIAALPPAERAAVADAVQALIAATPALQQAEVAFPYRTCAFACRRL